MQEKGGMFKSPFTINLASYAKTRGIDHLVIDCDVRPTLMRNTFPDALILDVDERALQDGVSELFQIVTQLTENKKNLIVDTGANTRRCFNFFFQMARFDDRVRVGELKVTVFCPVTNWETATHFFFSKLKTDMPWANLIQVRIRQALDYKADDYPAHPEERTILFPFIPTGLRNKLQRDSLTLQQAIEQKKFADPTQRDQGESFRRDLYAQLDQRQHLIF